MDGPNHYLRANQALGEARHALDADADPATATAWAQIAAVEAQLAQTMLDASKLPDDAAADDWRHVQRV
ncbi:hypothetical protein [Gordonia sihwensis]|uniref:hypothetical protein n=1 Tax=Gordonia sihwensis TaxID=173559 RepID=UPI0005EEFBC1|nr:hypothetical protein [Gordonia sihwensis]KJR10279.1 hypothetical protein UG54_01490 [Gordonia sihwensis]